MTTLAMAGAWVRTGGPKRVIKEWWVSWLEVLHAACPPNALEEYISMREACYQ